MAGFGSLTKRSAPLSSAESFDQQNTKQGRSATKNRQMGKNTTSNPEGTIAAPDDWWKRKLKELPKAKKFREKGL
nr:hypothetical protein CFP56_00079 [Quercus suber]